MNKARIRIDLTGLAFKQMERVCNAEIAVRHLDRDAARALVSERANELVRKLNHKYIEAAMLRRARKRFIRGHYFVTQAAFNAMVESNALPKGFQL